MSRPLSHWLARRLVALASALVPRWRRRQWREIWDAELSHRADAPLVRRSAGAFSHALWLRARDWSRDGLLLDVRYALRSLRRQPGFAALVLVVLTLGIGANTTIFSLANGLLLRPLGGMESPEQLVGVWRAREGQSPDLWSYPNYQDIRALTGAFSGAASFTTWSLPLRRGSELESVFVQMVSRDFFEVLGVEMTRGGGLVAPAETANVVLSHRAWRNRFGGRPMLGETIELNGQPLQVVGIAAPGFLGLDRVESPEMWAPLDLAVVLGAHEESALQQRGWSWLRVVGRLQDDATLEQARASAAATNELIREHAVNRDVTIMLVPHNGLAPQDTTEAGRVIAMLMTVVGLVLLIACANVANLLLARARTRNHEYGVRLALGASRSRLVRQLLVESMLLSLSAAAAGLLISQWSTRLLVAMFETVYDATFSVVVGPDLRVIGFSALLASFSVLVFGLIPSLRSSRGDTVPLIAGSRHAGWRRGWFSQGLVVAQVAMSVLVLVTAGLFVRSMRSISEIDPGLAADALLSVTPIALEEVPAASGLPAADTWRQQLEQRLATDPRVESVAWAESVPLSGAVGRRSVSVAPGDADSRMNLGNSAVGPGYFRTTGIPLLGGRDFTEEDARDGPPVMIINDTLAERLWPGESAVGRHLFPGFEPVEVVGVVATSKYFALTENPQPFFYLPLTPGNDDQSSLLIRTAGDPADLIPRVRDEIAALPVTIAARRLATLGQIVAATYGSQRAFARVIGVFGLLAFALAVAGAYGVISYLVTQRTGEIGVRVALGAPSGRVMRAVLLQTMLLGVLGVGLGLILTRAAAPAIDGLVEGIESTDTLTLAMVAAALLAAVALAGFIPARRAAHVDPLIALRNE